MRRVETLCNRMYVLQGKQYVHFILCCLDIWTSGFLTSGKGIVYETMVDYDTMDTYGTTVMCQAMTFHEPMVIHGVSWVSHETLGQHPTLPGLKHFACGASRNFTWLR
jgi:hypothetical protein